MQSSYFVSTTLSRLQNSPNESVEVLKFCAFVFSHFERCLKDMDPALFPSCVISSTLALARTFGSTCSVNVGEGSEGDFCGEIAVADKGLDNPGGVGDEIWISGTTNEPGVLGNWAGGK
jgi:hypothetical protein